MFLLVAVNLTFPFTCQALNFASQPSFTKATNAPLAGVLTVSSDIDSRVSVSVNDGERVWKRSFYDYGTEHAVPLLGFRAGRTNEITVTISDRYRNVVTSAQAVTFITDPLPVDFPNITLLHSDPTRMEPGYTLFIVDVFTPQANAYGTIVDDSGQIVWYNVQSGFDIRQLANGNLFATLSTNFVEFDLLGRTVQSWNAPLLPLDPHDGVPTDHGTILYLNDALESVANFPDGSTNSTVETANVLYQKVVEIAATNSSVLNTWSPIDRLDPGRISYLNGIADDGLPDDGYDTEHSNAVIEDPKDDSLIVSMRNQNAVVKFSRATGQIRWVLGPHENWGPAWQPYLLTPVGTPFAWQYGQHAPVITAQGTLMIYDDGNYRASPYDPILDDSQNYSRAVEYRINEDTMEISQVWEYGSATAGEWLYTGYEGNAEPEGKTGNVLIDFSAVSYVDGVPPSPDYPGAVMARLKEVTHDAAPQVVFDLSITMYDQTRSSSRDCSVYRAHRIADLYPHPPTPIADLMVNYREGVPSLSFSGDDTRKYVIEASSDLINWEIIGTPTEAEEQLGDYSFQDLEAIGFSPRYYRILTQ